MRAESTITFLVHGFNVNRKDGRDNFLRFAASLPGRANAVYVAVLWPGDHWSGAARIPSRAPMPMIRRKHSRATSVTWSTAEASSPSSHTVWVRVVMETVKRLNKDNYAIRQVCLLAAAIDDSPTPPTP